MFEDKYAKKYQKARNPCHYAGEHRGAADNARISKYSIPEEITMIFHGVSNYDYHFIKKF